jgi:quinol monooxygenase YgiN
MSIFVRARFDVHEGRQAKFEAVAEALRAHAESEDGTLTYRFFSAGAGSYLVLEEYRDSADAILHQDRTQALRGEVQECADLAYIEFYGPIWPELQEFVASVPHATWFPELGE